MDELDLLKKNWKEQENDFPQLSYDEIYKMLWKKSSSIVKWIFVISICELFLWAILGFLLVDENYWTQMEELHLKTFTIVLNTIGYCITFVFIYLFYRNYRKISATDDAKTLMKNILKTRKTVKFYIAYVLISTGLITLIISFFTIKNHQISAEAEEVAKYNFDLQDWLIFTGVSIIFLAVFLSAIWLFYRLIYGILLRKLNRNYKELKKLEL